MINATKEKLSSFFQGNMQYVVPFFQRSYVWNQENWDTLWEHIKRILDEKIKKHEHFIGTLIVKQRTPERIGETSYDLIDGQQRLTTFSILLKAIADTATNSGVFIKLAEKTNELLVFEDSRGDKHLRIMHSRNDKDYFETLMLNEKQEKLKNQGHRILQAYRYFHDKLAPFTDEERDELRNIILTNVPVISMMLAQEDDEQEIFDTINSLGVRLTTAELLKNHVFQYKEIQDKYEEYWFEVFEEDEDMLAFWNKKKTSGRVSRTNIDILLYCYLIIQTRREVNLEKLFQDYKQWLKDKPLNERKSFLVDLREYAGIYYSFPEGTEINEIAFSESEKRFFHVIENLEITTVIPLVLCIYKMVTMKKERTKMLGLLESYLVRRNVCRLTTKNYNNLFIQIMQQLIDSEEIDYLTLKEILIGFIDDTNRFPSDGEFQRAFGDEQISNSNAYEILYCIALYQLNNEYSDVKKLSSLSFSVEHIMPQKWETNWLTRKMREDEKAIRYKKIKTLGNLTLVTQNLNSKMKNSEWSRKKEHLKEYSKLRLTTDYLKLKSWDENAIQNRADILSSDALKIWRR
ncbi:DUF262 domain-containing HNH endonuclease family protein [Chryseolinea sp. H1M3-3]|uniref:DUF262 domain-containing protein n=1 Tax=Chryseolinea sp. H1M3-3 TaxID=3034144 RepID=UPI0023EBA050|nr:DUF262 domain-containing HNH endonuclease family protein [Chryseolinea sp. H1M3-3]